MLHAFSTKIQAAVGSLVVPPDSGECVEALELIKSLPLDGVLVTGDAAFTTEAIATAIRERGGHYFLFVKDNQPDLRAELERAFGDVSPSIDHRRGTGPHRRQAA
jgi:predicted transposase YbfD/YdcC